MMALNERYPNAWHMLIERHWPIFIYKDDVVVYRWVYDNVTA